MVTTAATLFKKLNQYHIHGKVKLPTVMPAFEYSYIILNMLKNLTHMFYDISVILLFGDDWV